MQPLTIITKCIILNVSAVLDPPLQSLLKQAFEDFVLIRNPETHSVEQNLYLADVINWIQKYLYFQARFIFSLTFELQIIMACCENFLLNRQGPTVSSLSYHVQLFQIKFKRHRNSCKFYDNRFLLKFLCEQIRFRTDTSFHHQ